MARPVKQGLDYFPLDVNFCDDPKIIELLHRHGALGLSVYVVLLSLVYRQGYYLEMPLENLASLVCRVIGIRWTKIQTVSQVIQTCAAMELIDSRLFAQGVITAVAIQSRYREIKRRSQFKPTKYWLLENDEIQQPLESASGERVFAAETPINATETPIIATEMHTKERKEKKRLNAPARVYNRSAPKDFSADHYKDELREYDE